MTLTRLLHYQALSERYRRFEKFSRDHLRISDRRYGHFDELAGGPLPYDLILSGSDQIWNPKILPDGRFDPVFFGTFFPEAPHCLRTVLRCSPPSRRGCRRT